MPAPMTITEHAIALGLEIVTPEHSPYPSCTEITVRRADGVVVPLRYYRSARWADGPHVSALVDADGDLVTVPVPRIAALRDAIRQAVITP